MLTCSVDINTLQITNNYSRNNTYQHLLKGNLKQLAQTHIFLSQIQLDGGKIPFPKINNEHVYIAGLNSRGSL